MLQRDFLNNAIVKQQQQQEQQQKQQQHYQKDRWCHASPSRLKPCHSRVYGGCRVGHPLSLPRTRFAAVFRSECHAFLSGRPLLGLLLCVCARIFPLFLLLVDLAPRPPSLLPAPLSCTLRRCWCFQGWGENPAGRRGRERRRSGRDETVARQEGWCFFFFFIFDLARTILTVNSRWYIEQLHTVVGSYMPHLVA